MNVEPKLPESVLPVLVRACLVVSNPLYARRQTPLHASKAGWLLANRHNRLAFSRSQTKTNAETKATRKNLQLFAADVYNIS